MIPEASELVDAYLTWLRDRTLLREIGEYVEVTTPFLDRHNDYLQVYLRRHNGGYKLSDGGYILADLKITGVDLSSKKRKELLNTTLNGFGVNLEDEALIVHASDQNFPLRKHNLIQAMLAINDMFYVGQATVASLFKEDVSYWLEEHDVRFVPQVKFTGLSGFDHLFDFVIPKSRRQPERIVQTMTKPDKQTAIRIAFAWGDTAKTRPSNALGFAIINDIERDPAPGVLEALKAYDVESVLWSHREALLERLAA